MLERNCVVVIIISKLIGIITTNSIVEVSLRHKLPTQLDSLAIFTSDPTTSPPSETVSTATMKSFLVNMLATNSRRVERRKRECTLIEFQRVRLRGGESAENDSGSDPSWAPNKSPPPSDSGQSLPSDSVSTSAGRSSVSALASPSSVTGSAEAEAWPPGVPISG
jgi:hypothetical protein